MAFEQSLTAGRHRESALYAHPSSIVKIERLLPLLPDSALSILDVGCGDGRLSAELLSRGHRLSGIDANADAVRLAGEKGIAARLGNIEERWQFSDASFDLVLLLDVLEHLISPVHALKEAHRVLREDGQAIIAFPNHFDLRQRLGLLLGGGIVHWSHRKYPEASAASYAHIRFLRLPELNEVIGVSGFAALVWQFNFMGGGVLPRRFTPRFLRASLTRTFPNLFSGKFIAFLTKQLPASNFQLPKIIILPETPEGL